MWSLLLLLLAASVLALGVTLGVLVHRRAGGQVGTAFTRAVCLLLNELDGVDLLVTDNVQMEVAFPTDFFPFLIVDLDPYNGTMIHCTKGDLSELHLTAVARERPGDGGEH